MSNSKVSLSFNNKKQAYICHGNFTGQSKTRNVEIFDNICRNLDYKTYNTHAI